MTGTEFKKLPMLLFPRQAREALSCNKQSLEIMRQAHPELAVRLPGMKHFRYRKVVVAKIAGIEYE